MSLFLQRFQAECIEGSAIAPELYAANVEVIADTGFWEPNRALNQRVSRFWQKKPPHNYGAIAMFRQESGEYWQGKPERPRPKPEKPEETLKYENLAGSGSRAYLPSVDAATRLKIGERNGVALPTEGSVWQWAQTNEVPLVLTEGAKKSLALLSMGYLAIALTGVNGGYRSNERIGDAVIPLDKPELIEDLKPFLKPGQRVVLAFDQDSKPKTRNKVAAALTKFGGLLAATGAKVAIAEWEPQQGKGIDDLIVNAGAEAAEKAIAEAVPFEQWAIARRLAYRVRRAPDLNIGDREFIEVAAELPSFGIVALHGGKGTAKSKAIGAMLGGQSWLSVTPLQSLAREQAEAWVGAFINDHDSYGDRFLANGVIVDGGSVCLPSLLKVRGIAADVLILDESTAGLQFLLGSKLCNKDGLRPLLLSEFERRVRAAKLVILADADLTEEAIAYIEKIRGERAYLVRSERKPLQWKANVLECGKKEAIAAFIERVKLLPQGKVIYLNCDERSQVEHIAAALEAEGIKVLTITQNTSGGDVERSFLAGKGGDLPALVQQGIQVVISSPSVLQGFSIEQNAELIDSVWGIYAGSTISADGIAQALDRVRSDAERFIYIPKRGRGYSRISRASTVSKFLREFKLKSTVSAQLVANSLKPATAATVDKIDWHSENLKLLASFEAERNRGMASLKDTVLALLRREGKRITTLKPSLNAEAIAYVTQCLNFAREQAKEAKIVAILQAPDITPEQAQKLEDKARIEPLTQQELDQLERFYLGQFYRSETVDRSLIEFDRDGRTRQTLKRLEFVLDEAIAIERTTSSIERNSSTPQDWTPEALQHFLLVRSGAAELIQKIWDGELTDLPDEVIDPIAKKLKQHERDFAIAFNFSNIGSVNNRQAVFTLLDWCGIRRIAHRQRQNGKITRSYQVDTENLQRLKAVLDRRRNPIHPPQELINLGGVDHLLRLPHLPPDDAADIAQMWAAAHHDEAKAAVLAVIDELRRAAA